MVRKLSLCLAAAALIAFAAPSLASASQLTNSKGVALLVGSQFEGTAVKKVAIAIEEGPNFECEPVKFANKVTVNKGGIVTAIPANSGSGSCSELVSIAKFELKALELKSATSGSATANVELAFKPGGGCRYEGPVALTYTAGGSEIHVSGTLPAATAEACVRLTVAGDFALSMLGQPVVID